MDIEEFFSELPVYDLGPHSHADALEILETPPREELGEGWTEAVAYEAEHTYVVHDLGPLERDEDTGQLVWTLGRLPACDVLRDIECDVKCRVVIGEALYDPQDITVVTCLSPLVYKGLRIYMDEKKLPRTFTVKYRCFVLNDVNRELLRTMSEVRTSTHVYRDGDVVPLSEERVVS